ncbi:hypothetical protein HYU19_01505 [Candidatus Woesearchaeota archaeon]|nr:hypothetical protein [Candidatus Woesearchaeota archaeon]
MSTSKLDQNQLAELTRRAHQKAKKRRTGDIIESKQVGLDDAVGLILGDSESAREEVGVASGITEADILAAYEEMTHPSVGKRLYRSAVSAALDVARALKKPVIIGTALTAAAVGIVSYGIIQLWGDDGDRVAEYVMESDVTQARQAITEAHSENNEELRLMKLTRAVGDFYGKRAYGFADPRTMNSSDKYTYFDTALKDGVPANDLVSVIDALCPLQSGGFASCATRTIGNRVVGERDTASVITSYVLRTHDSGIGLGKVLDTIDEARKVVIERYKLQGTRQPSLYVLPGMIIDQAGEILKLDAPPTFPASPGDKSF